MMAWFGCTLAANGYIAVAVNHPGNNGAEGYTVLGFSTWWERARDLSTVIDAMLADPAFGSRIDARRIGAAGFSLCGYTVIEIAGGITVPADFTAFPKLAGLKPLKFARTSPPPQETAGRLPKLAGLKPLKFARTSPPRKKPRGGYQNLRDSNH